MLTKGLRQPRANVTLKKNYKFLSVSKSKLEVLEQFILYNILYY